MTRRLLLILLVIGLGAGCRVEVTIDDVPDAAPAVDAGPQGDGGFVINDAALTDDAHSSDAS